MGINIGKALGSVRSVIEEPLSGQAKILGNAIGFGGGSGHLRPVTKNPYNVSTYGRPQTNFAMNDAMNSFRGVVNPTAAPTYGDVAADTGKYKRGFSNTWKDSPYFTSLSSPFSGGREGGFFSNSLKKNYYGPDMNTTAMGVNQPGVNYSDFNGDLVGGKQAYRYAWEQPNYQAQQPARTPAPTPQQEMALQQTPSAPTMSSPASSQPISNQESTQGWGFEGNNQPATFGDSGRIDYGIYQQPYQGGYTGGYNPYLWSGNYNFRQAPITQPTAPVSSNNLFSTRGNYFNPSFGRY